jgi:hypothetical protein
MNNTLVYYLYVKTENPRWPPCKCCLYDVYCIESGSSEFFDPENVGFAAEIKSLACLDAEIMGKQVLNSDNL